VVTPEPYNHNFMIKSKTPFHHHLGGDAIVLDVACPHEIGYKITLYSIPLGIKDKKLGNKCIAKNWALK
jgi:hypothetical protein